MMGATMSMGGIVERAIGAVIDVELVAPPPFDPYHQRIVFRAERPARLAPQLGVIGDRQRLEAATDEPLCHLLEDVSRRVHGATGHPVSVRIDPQLRDALADRSLARAVGNVAENAARLAARRSPLRFRPLRRREAASSVNHETDDAVHLMAVGALRGAHLLGQPGAGDERVMDALVERIDLAPDVVQRDHAPPVSAFFWSAS